MSLTPAETQYRDVQRQLLARFIQAAQQQPPFIDDDCDAESLHYLKQLESLPQLTGTEYAETGQWVVCRTIAAYAHLVPLLPRDLLWHFGGDCLHYMPDEEIDKFQRLDERLHEAIGNGQDFNYEQERAKILGLH
ncbi:PA2817 family protein [Gilvimarinus xylanilyticus]|uniref:Dehydrogenase n=1 Tax=Gilvimarinus xylanilyticus TaxID=2944139 RepID=A0A9X2HY09_9GAMM|nr:PA2817 family protein [Gilvimarinus xylanilyticus]MCP8899154.1 dehydrogenase [Gilvimarinus xylanilyticus]